MPFSKAGIGALITIVFVGLKFLGVEVPEGTEIKLVEAVGTIIGVVLLVWGQLDRADLKMGIIRR